MIKRRRLVSGLIVLLAFALSGHFECRESAACDVPTVTHNEGFA